MFFESEMTGGRWGGGDRNRRIWRSTQESTSPNSRVWNGQTVQGTRSCWSLKKAWKKIFEKRLRHLNSPRCHFLSLIFSSPSCFFLLLPCVVCMGRWGGGGGIGEISLLLPLLIYSVLLLAWAEGKDNSSASNLVLWEEGGGGEEDVGPMLLFSEERKKMALPICEFMLLWIFFSWREGDLAYVFNSHF